MFSPRLFYLLPLLATFPIALLAQGGDAPRQGLRFLQGYVREIAGEHIDYHCFHPYAKAALLTRCLDGNRVIEWETEPLPSEGGEFATFVWIAAHSTGTSSGDRGFTLSLNGVPTFHFTTVKDRRVWKWSLVGRGGAQLSFDGKWEDTVNDLFGYMYLRVPVRDYPKGEPIAIRVVGDSSGSRDWYMTFKYRIRDSVALQVQPALLKARGGPRQLIDVLVDYTKPEGSLELSIPGEKPVQRNLTFGFNRVEFSVRPSLSPKELELTIAVDNLEQKQTILLEPVRTREFWLLPHSHNDIGYSDLQADVAKKQEENLRAAVRLVKKTAGYPPEARFKWNTEILWGVEKYLSNCSKAEEKEFFEVIREGGIDLNALYANQLTGICRPEELLRLTDYARELAAKHGLTIDDAMITDIPGFTWAMVPALAEAGIKYFSSGPNYIPTLPDGGDRVGSFNKEWGDRPFYWVSPSGEEKVLFWVAGKGYSWFHGWIAGKAGPSTAWNLFEYLRELDARQYPYDMVQLRYTIVADNGPTDANLPDFVKEWNEKYVTPRLVIATASSMFHEFEQRYGAVLPSFAGEITPYWEDGALSTLRELGMVRRSSERLVEAEALICILKGKPDRPGYQDAWREVHLFDEHTWGAWNSISDPDNSFVLSQWKVKERYALEADRRSRQLLEAALGDSGPGEVVDVVNPSSWERTGLVLLSPEMSRGAGSLRDANGTEVPSQRLSGGELAFVAARVPPLGARRYTLGRKKASVAGAVEVHPNWIGNGLLRVEIDPESGAIRSLKTSRGAECVDTTDLPGLNLFLYVPGRNPSEARRARVIRIDAVDRGPVVGMLRITSDAPGCRSLIQEIRLVDGLNRVEISNTIDKLPVREKEAVHIGFPLLIPEGKVRLDGGWGILRPGADQLPGSCLDYLSSGRWIDVSNQDCGLTCTITETPLVEIGAMTDETPNEKGYRVWRSSTLPGTTFFSYVMNNYWHTNYKADQQGRVSTEYSLIPHGIFRADEAYRRALEQNQPMLVRTSRTGIDVPASLFSLSSPGVVVTSLKVSQDGKAVMVRLFAASGRAEECEILWGVLHPRRIFVSSLKETRDLRAPRKLTLPAYGILTLRCER